MQDALAAEVRLREGGGGNAGPVESVENQKQVSHTFHRPLKISQRRRDLHISTAPAWAAWKSGKPTPGFPLSHPAHAMTMSSLSSNQTQKKKGSRPLCGLLIILLNLSGPLRHEALSCSFFD
jgi:hypothetical protein